MASPSRDDIVLLRRETPFQGYFRTDRYTLRHPLFEGGMSGDVTREVFERGHAAAVLPYDPECETVVLIEQFRAGSPVLVAEMGTNDARSERLPQLHRVFEGGHTLPGPVFLLDGQNREIGSMDRYRDVAFGGQPTERRTTLFFPGEVLDERQFHSLVTAPHQIIEKRDVIVAREERK